MNTDKFYKSIKEDKGWYFVEYTPANPKNYANLTLTIMTENAQKINITQSMEKELKNWIQRYKVPLLVSAWDIEDNQYNFDELNKSEYLVGFFDDGGKIYMSWESNANKPPDTVLEKEYLDSVYSNVDVVSSLQHAENRKIKNKQIERGVNIIFIVVFIIFLWTLLFEVILQYNPVVALFTSLYIIVTACKKIFEYMGVWPFKTKREKEKDDEKKLKDQFYYFYKQNPEGYERFKRESLDKMIREKNAETARDLKVK